MSGLEIIGLAGSAVGGGVINAVAGGGTLLTFPALLAFGTSPVTANATSTLALVIGTSDGMFGNRQHIKPVVPWLRRFLPVSLVGGLIGSALLTHTSNQTFGKLVPFLILFATVLFLTQSFFRRYAGAHLDTKANPRHLWGAVFFQFLVSIYGGYFGAGITGLLLVLLCAGFQLQAEQYNTDQQKLEQLKARAEAGEVEAQYELAGMYCQGLGTQQDFKQAVKWLRKAADQGLPDAEYALALAYYHGQGVKQDTAESLKWSCKAAEHGLDEAQLTIGKSYLFGARTNYVEAEKWVRKAANQGLAGAQFMLGYIYSQGLGLQRNPEEAIKWYRLAAEQAYPAAQGKLGIAYFKGDVGMAEDYVQAYKWLILGAAQGDQTSIEMRQIIHAYMTPVQIAEAQRLSTEFIPKNKRAKMDLKLTLPNFDDSPKIFGTGFFITDDGYLISNYHVVKDAARVRLLTAAGLLDAQVVKVDAANDLALLKAVGAFTPLPIAASRTVKLGGTVATIGFPDIGLQGFAPKLAKGEIASLAGAADDPRYFQISLPVQHGNSGGALVDVHGNVVGIVAARLGVEIGKAVTSDELPENVNYAVKSSLLLSFLESVPDVDAKLKEPNSLQTAAPPFEEVVKSAQDAAVLVLVY